MQFDKRYNRTEFVNFLKNNFLPEDFVTGTAVIPPVQSMAYTSGITKLGACESLDLVVYEIRHKSKHDARVGLSKEAFRFLADEWENRALVVFVPEDNDDNYRFSLITIDLEETESGRIAKRYSNPRRYSYFLGKGIAYHTPNKYLNDKGRVKERSENGKQISAFEDLRNRFSVEVLTEAFYSELSDWYAWAVKTVRFPNKLDDTTDDDKFNAEATIRLVTRLIFVWFLKQKHLIPDEFFDEKYVAENLLNDFNPNLQTGLFGYKSLESKYYKAILQNLFFAMLNSPITKDGESELSERHFRKGRGDFDNNKLMRYESMFKNPRLFIDLANKTVPFLNGGLFDCLDDKENGNYLDGFSDREVVKNALVVPDYLFFGEEAGKDIDLSEWYNDKKKKKVSARGIIDILKRYNFTVQENTPFDQEVSLDPELLGKVFENLLASYNPETQTTARKQTGSFYTPREIVQYMVDESLVAHLKRTVGVELESEYRKLISYVDEEIQLTKDQKLQVMESIYRCKVLDPACGSGAFPVGILQQMVHILSQLDPFNEQWKKMMLDEAVNDSRNAFLAESKEEREERLRDIEKSFDANLNNPDYARKLYLIENCIYGVDIQPIAIQISKLRFFISLVVDQKTNNDPTKNFGIRPLPNLEAKFVAANSLVPLAKQEENIGRTEDIVFLENRLKEANHKIFGAKTIRTKRKWKVRLIELRAEMIAKLEDNGFLTADATNQMASWDMFDQNSAAVFFDADWMFGIKDGFDVVIANPPYVLLQNTSLSDNDKNTLVDLYSVAQYKVDLYHLFIEKGYKLLKSEGFLCYINPSNFLTNNYTNRLRYHILTDFSPNFIINITDNVFDASVNTCIIGLTKQKQINSNIKYYKGNVEVKGLHLSLLSCCSPKDYLNNVGYVIQPLGSSAVQNLIDKIDSLSVPLKSIASVNFGMQLRNRKIFPNDVIQDPSKESLTSYHRECITGKDIHEWHTTYCNRYCFFNRIAKCGGCWDETVHNAKIKVLVRQVGATPVCGIDTSGYAVLNSAFIITSQKINLLLLLGLINSNVLKFYWSQKFEDKRKTFPKIKGTYLELLPIVKRIDLDFSSLVQDIVEYSAKGIDNTFKIRHLNLLIYHLYKLTYDEVLIVDPATHITREEYEQKL